MKFIFLLLIFCLLTIPYIFSQIIQVTSGYDIYGRQDQLYPNIPYHDFGSSSTFKSESGITCSAEFLVPLRNVLFPVHEMYIGLGVAYPTNRKLTYDFSRHDRVDVDYRFIPIYISGKIELANIKSIDTDMEVLAHLGMNTLSSHDSEFFDNAKGIYYWATGLGFVKHRFILQSLYQVNQAVRSFYYYPTLKKYKVTIVDSHINFSLGVRL